MRAAEEFAPAKINLCLHVTGRRPDGYHLLDSLVVFADVGDVVRIAPGGGLTITGPQAGALGAGADNLCLRAAHLARLQGAITLEKHLPVAAGLGGGSADAAAVLRLAARLGLAPPSEAAILALGADVPVCLNARSVRMRGIGEDLAPLVLPQAWVVLVNPGLALATGAIFSGLAAHENAPLPDIPPLADVVALAGFLAMQRNDLEAPAITLAPVIGEALAALGAMPGCLLARMSGSGACSFGLFAGEAGAKAAAAALAGARPGWWVRAASLRGSG